MIKDVLIFILSHQIARRLLGKILIDLRNTREEALHVAVVKGNQDNCSNSTKTAKANKVFPPNISIKTDDIRRSNTTSEMSIDQDDDDDKETKYRLDPKSVYEPLCFVLYVLFYLLKFYSYSIRYANVMTPERHVRTRLYFTSVSANCKRTS